jgi:uncharacterized protein YbbC (DUF1343 family)
MFNRFFPLLFAALSVQFQCTAQKPQQMNKTQAKHVQSASTIIPAADQIDQYLPLLKGKKVALLVNHTSTIGGTHIIDTLLKLGVNIKVAFGPEHGFRGDAPDGAKIETTTDAKTGVPVVSL